MGSALDQVLGACIKHMAPFLSPVSAEQESCLFAKLPLIVCHEGLRGPLAKKHLELTVCVKLRWFPD